MNPADDPYTTTLRGLIALLHENLDDAEQLAWLAVTTGRKTRHPDHLCRGLVLVGLVHSYRGDHEAAHRVLTEAMQSAGRVRLRTYQRYVLAPIAATWA